MHLFKKHENQVRRKIKKRNRIKQNRVIITVTISAVEFHDNNKKNIIAITIDFCRIKPIS